MSSYDAYAVADPEPELRRGRVGAGGGGAVLIYSLWWPFSLQSFPFVLPKIRGESRAPRPGPSQMSATATLLVQDV